MIGTEVVKHKDKKQIYGIVKSGRHNSLVFNLSADKKDDLENITLIVCNSSLKVKINITTDMENGSIISLPKIICKDNKKAYIEILTLPKNGILKKIIEFKFCSDSDIKKVRFPSLRGNREIYIRSLLCLPKNIVITSYDFLSYEEGHNIRNVGELNNFLHGKV